MKRKRRGMGGGGGSARRGMRAPGAMRGMAAGGGQNRAIRPADRGGAIRPRASGRLGALRGTRGNLLARKGTIPAPRAGAPGRQRRPRHPRRRPTMIRRGGGGGGGGGGGLGHPAWKAAPGTAAFPRRPGAAACRREAVRAAARPGARISGEERGRAGLCLFSLDSHRAQGPFRGGRGAGEGREGERTAACAARSAALYAQKRKGPAAAAARGPACAPPGRQGARTDTGSGCTAPSFLLFFLHLRPPPSRSPGSGRGRPPRAPTALTGAG